MTHRFLPLLFIALSAGAGCRDDEPPRPASPANTDVTAPDSSVPRAAPSSTALQPPTALSSLARTTYLALAQVTRECQLEPRQLLHTGCTGDTANALVTDFRSGKQSLRAAFPGLVAALSAQHLSLQTAAARLLSRVGRLGLEPGSSAVVDRAAAMELLQLLPRLPPPLQRLVLPAAVHAALLSDQLSSLNTALDSSLKPLKSFALEYFFIHGGKSAMDRLRALLQNGQDPEAAAMLWGTRHLAKGHPARQETCLLIRASLADRRPMVALRSRQLAQSCGPEAISLLLAHIDKESYEHRLDKAFARPLRNLCSSHGTATETQCRQFRQLLARTARDKSNSLQIRGNAMHELAVQFPDAATLTLFKHIQAGSKSGVAAMCKELENQVRATMANAAASAEPLGPKAAPQ